MSAAFTLDFSGPETPCDFPGCVLGSFHEGNHELAPKPKPIAWTYDRHCVVCGVPFTVLGAELTQIFDTCGSQECLLHYAKHHATAIPVYCPCAQRPYPHELEVHKRIGSEKPGTYATGHGDTVVSIVRFQPEGLRWPWSLKYAPSMER
jgi:hypothetical protein